MISVFGTARGSPLIRATDSEALPMARPWEVMAGEDECCPNFSSRRTSWVMDHLLWDHASLKLG